jgi:PAS domain S-box-containing protein
MDGNSPDTHDFSELRGRAEKRLVEGQPGVPPATAPELELRRLIHELSVHQIELEMQKDELELTAENLEDARRDLQKELERYTDLYDFAPVGYLTLARDGCILEANLTAGKLLGAERSVLKGSRFPSFITDEDLPSFNALMQRVFDTRQPENCQARISSALQAGAIATAAASAMKTLRIDAVIGEEGMACRVALSDISRQKEVELENATLQENLGQAQKMDSIGRLAGGIAHDFNNMLASILGNAELALCHAGPGHPMHRELEAIIKTATRAAELTGQLLAFARKQTVMPKILDLHAAIDSSVKMLRRLIGEHIAIDWRPAGNIDYVRMDPVQIDQILLNLCLNARDAISGTGRITIRTGVAKVTPSECSHGHCCMVPGEYVLISVTDDGSGIDQQTLPHIFEPFFTTKELGRGTGLGLSTVYGIVKQNSGFLECTSEPGKGTTVALYLPRHAITAPESEYVAPPEPFKSSKASILLVEDEPEILGIIKRILENTGYAVHAAQNPSEAIRIASEGRYEFQLLLTDVVMPEMNGSELACKLNEMIPDLKIIFMSGYTADVIAGCAVGDDETRFIQKPFSIATLVTTVEKVLKA